MAKCLPSTGEPATVWTPCVCPGCEGRLQATELHHIASDTYHYRLHCPKCGATDLRDEHPAVQMRWSQTSTEVRRSLGRRARRYYDVQNARIVPDSYIERVREQE